jgi:phage/plasmid-associated DNA primase
VRDTKDSRENARRTLRLVTSDGALLPGGGDGGGKPPPGGPPGGSSLDPVLLDHGSDVEIAYRLADAVRREHSEVRWCEGRLWVYGGTHWVPYLDCGLRLAAHAYDGAFYRRPGRKNADQVQLGRNRINSILSELGAILAAPGFFDRAPLGINCQSGFIRLAEDGGARLEPHTQDHRCRHLVPGHWTPPEPGEDRLSPPPDSLLGKLLYGSFAGDGDADDKIKLIGETMGSSAAAIVTSLRRPKAVILYGIHAQNGKSTILDLCRAMLPESAVVAISPDKFGNEYYIIGLAGALLNATDELSTAKAIASDAFKTAVTGGMMSGRAPYRDVVSFRPRAQHVLGANVLPSFSGGVDPGVERRLLLVVFNRVIPPAEQIPELAHCIAAAEADLLLAFVVAGASRLRANGAFTVPPSSAAELRKWLNAADPVRGWVAAQVTVVTVDRAEHFVTSRRAYEQFIEWARAEGYRAENLPAINGFVQRLRACAPGIGTRHGRVGNCLIGLRIGAKQDDGDEDAV